MTTISDADLLDSVRRLRSHMVVLDNIHNILNQVQDIDDQTIVKQVQSLLIDMPPLNLRVAHVLRNIENTRQYRDMVKKFNLSEEDDE